MGVLTDLFIATDSDVAQLEGDDAPSDLFPTIDIKGLGIVDLAVLYGVTRDERFDPTLPAFPVLSGANRDDGPWINGVPPELVEHLAGAGPEELSALATTWFGESPPYGWELDGLRAVLSDLAAFASKAVEERKAIFVWTSL
jgi:hypothetical protein